MFVVDTNILVYAADEDSPYYRTCCARLEVWRRQTTAWYLTWPICAEFLRVVTHPRVFRAPWTALQAWAFLDALLASPALGVLLPTDRHRDVWAEVVGELPHLAGNVMHDVATAVIMREHGIKTIMTRDADFHRFPFLEPRDPIA